MTKRAVVIATNYEGTSSALAGCINDADDWAAELDRRGHDVALLRGQEASRAGILGALERAVDATKYRDQLVITYSGHGTWVPDRDGDEADSRDEAICPDDYARAGMITDDDLHRVYSAAGFGERVVMISDSCHSGSLNRFAPPIETSEQIPAQYDQYEASSPRRVKFLPPAEWISDDRLTWALATVAQNAPSRGFMRRGALVFSACQADQVTFDIQVDGRPCGLFTYVALQVLRSLPEAVSYRDWHKQVRRLLPSVDYPNVSPALDGTATQRKWNALA